MEKTYLAITLHEMAYDGDTSSRVRGDALRRRNASIMHKSDEKTRAICPLLDRSPDPHFPHSARDSAGPLDHTGAPLRKISLDNRGETMHEGYRSGSSCGGSPGFCQGQLTHRRHIIILLRSHPRSSSSGHRWTPKLGDVVGCFGQRSSRIESTGQIERYMIRGTRHHDGRGATSGEHT